MTRDYAAMTTLIVERLQSSGTADFSVAMIDNGLTQAIAELSDYHPHIVGVVFNVEGRSGRSTSTNADNLVDTTNGQFLSGDATDEKVIHNTTDNSWAVVLSYSSTSQIGISSDIMTVDDQYKIYNKQCQNHKQIYIGDVPNYEAVHSVEYPIGERRNWKRYDRILEIDKDVIPDTNSNTAKITNLPDDEALIRFIQPHALPNLTDWAATFSATAAVSATSIALTALQGAGTIVTGAEFNIENHRTTYIVSASVTIASSAVTVGFYPPLEAAVSSTAWVVTVRKTTLEPHYEEMVADLASARIALGKAIKFANTIAFGGGDVATKFIAIGERRLAEAQSRLKRSVPPKTKIRYPAD